jgi:hypothetical protein
MRKISFFLLIIISTHGFSQTFPTFKVLRYEEDYSIAEKDSGVINWYRRMKYRPLKYFSNSYASLGGDIRLQYQYFKNEKWGDSPHDKDGFLLTRWLAHADVHIGNRLRIFGQLQSSTTGGLNRAPTPVEENPLEIHQAFADVYFLQSKLRSFTFRIGRQELLYGSQRLVALRDGTNNRQSFDAAKLTWIFPKVKADLFYSHHVKSQPLLFDDAFNSHTKFWGVYIVRNNIPVLQNIDIYYLGQRKAKAIFDDGSGRELRHSTGLRIWNNSKEWRYDMEGVFQWGKLSEQRISAWTLSLNAGYKFHNIKYKPEAGIKTELISGDIHTGDGKLQTFNPLFPRGGYFGLVSLIGPANLFDIHPSLSLVLSKKIMFNADYDVFWRYSKRDGIYGPNVVLIYSGKESDHKYIGRQFSADLNYTPNIFLYFRTEFTWFKAGEFLKDEGSGKNIFFTAATIQIRF